MKRMEELLPSYFKRVHKSFIVSLDKISGFDSGKVYLKDKKLPIGQQYKGGLEKAVMILNETIDELITSNHLYQLPIIINANQRDRLFEAR
jgi:hypothetical protein